MQRNVNLSWRRFSPFILKCDIPHVEASRAADTGESNEEMIAEVSGAHSEGDAHSL